MKNRTEKNKNTNFISGIHNYCDAWCDRCQFTSKCAIFRPMKDSFDTPESKDINNKEFWDSMTKIFADTMKMVVEKCEEMGIDTNFTDEEFEEYQIKAEERKRRTNEKIVPKMAMEYSDISRKWFEEEEKFLTEKAESMNTLYSAGVDCSDIVIEGAYIEDAIEVILWYQHFIYVKFMRAMLHDEDEENQDPEFKEIMSFDANGSAKVALIGIDRSISAWGSLLKRIPEKHDEILDILVHLEKLRKAAEKEFPNAREFKRPGFDGGEGLW